MERSIGRPRPGARRAALAPGTGGRAARTVLRPLERLGPATLVEAELGTGRTHQVRVHLAFLGHPVLGDPVYGDPETDPFSIGRLALHAAVLGFVHPRDGREAPLPAGPAARLQRAAGAAPPPPPRRVARPRAATGAARSTSRRNGQPAASPA